MKDLPLKYEAIMLRRGFAPVVAIIALSLIALFGGTALVAWRTTLLDSYLPQSVKEFFGKPPTGENGVPVTSDSSEPSGEDSEPTAEDPTKEWKTYTNAELGFSFKYPEDWIKKQPEPGSDIEVVLLESSDGKSYLNFYNSGGAFGIEPGFEVSKPEPTIFYTSNDYPVNVEILDLGNGNVVASGSFTDQITGLVFTYGFDSNFASNGVEILELILSTFKFL
ncbi:MAG: PsbP-related protein [Patescibacteria group bacterium]